MDQSKTFKKICTELANQYPVNYRWQCKFCNHIGNYNELSYNGGHGRRKVYDGFVYKYRNSGSVFYHYCKDKTACKSRRKKFLRDKEAAAKLEKTMKELDDKYGTDEDRIDS